MTAYREFGALPISPDQAAIHRALEWEADTAALYRSLKVWRVLCPLFDTQALSTKLPAEESWFIAVELLFWIMDFVNPVTSGGPLATHPSPIARRINLYETTAAGDWAPTKDEASSPLLPWVQRNAFTSRTPADPSFKDIDRAKSELKNLARQLEVLLPLLEPHRRLRSRAD
jgi:hypothetical protein